MGTQSPEAGFSTLLTFASLQPVNRLSLWGKGEKIIRKGKGKGNPFALRFVVTFERLPKTF